MTAKTKPAPRKPKQSFIPGTAPPSIPEIDAAAERYVETRNQRQELTKDEVKLHDALLGLMRENKVDVYEYDGFVVSILTDSKVKVKRKAEKEPGDE